MMPAPIATGRRPYQRPTDVPVKFRRRIAELEGYFGTLRESDAGLRDAVIMLDHYAWLPDGPQRMDQFLSTAACWIDVAERERLKAAALAAMRTYDAREAGKLVGLTWAVRCDHKITTMIAVDTPSEEVLDAKRKQHDIAYQRNKRVEKSTLPKPIPANKRRALSTLERRLAAIHVALSMVDQMPIADLCEVLSRDRHGPFNTLRGASLARVVRRVIDQDRTSLSTELRRNPDWPGLQPPLWVTRKASVEEKAVTTPDRQSHVLSLRPTKLADYRIQFQRKLATFTDRDELLNWFISEMPAIKDLGSEAEMFELQELVVKRRRELLALLQPASEG